MVKINMEGECFQPQPGILMATGGAKQQKQEIPHQLFTDLC